MAKTERFKEFSKPYDQVYKSGYDDGMKKTASLQTEVERLKNEVSCFLAMKDGVAIRIAGLEAEIERLRSWVTDRVP